MPFDSIPAAGEIGIDFGPVVIHEYRIDSRVGGCTEGADVLFVDFVLVVEFAAARQIRVVILDVHIVVESFHVSEHLKKRRDLSLCHCRFLIDEIAVEAKVFLDLDELLPGGKPSGRVLVHPLVEIVVPRPEPATDGAGAVLVGGLGPARVWDVDDSVPEIVIARIRVLVRGNDLAVPAAENVDIRPKTLRVNLILTTDGLSSDVVHVAAIIAGDGEQLRRGIKVGMCLGGGERRYSLGPRDQTPEVPRVFVGLR